MWDFLLVLGQVPGTDIQITFLEVVLFCLLISLFWFSRKQLLKLRLVYKYLANLHIYLRVKKGAQLHLPF